MDTSQYPQIAIRISQEHQEWRKLYEASEGRKFSQLIREMLDSLIDYCGDQEMPRWPFEFHITCATRQIKPTSGLAAETKQAVKVALSAQEEARKALRDRSGKTEYPRGKRKRASGDSAPE